MTDSAGRVLCRLGEIEDGEGRGFEIEDPAAAGGKRAIFVIREDEAVHGYENTCPHLGTPLDFPPDHFISADGSHIVCSTHGALFRIEDGYCFSGPCAGASLRPVPVRVDREGRVRLDDS